MTFLYLNSDRLGSGPDEALGARLLGLFIDKLVESALPVDLVGCVNGGVLLTTREGPILEGLRRLEARGAKILSCGTCLDHLGLREALKIGGVGSMDGTVKILAEADRVLSPC